jgi:hypothetical protein
MRYLPAIIVFGAAGAGYLYTQEGLVKTVSSATWVSHEENTAISDPAVVERLANAPREEVIAVPSPEIANFGEIFRFDWTPQAVAGKWSRVSTGLSDVRYQGYRVPVVTGTAESDLAGSLTFYFDDRPKLRRITFLGTTADPQRLVEFLSKQYGFRRIQSRDARVTSYRVRFRYSGVLHVVPAEVLEKHMAATNYRVELSLER